MTVTFKIANLWAPVAEFKRDEEFRIEIEVDATGSGANKSIIQVYDIVLGRYMGAWATVDPLSPGKYTLRVNLTPLDQWYPTPIPGILNWTIMVGYIEGDTWVITDSRSAKVPRIVDRLCNKPFCVGVSNPYPAPREEIAISGREVDIWIRDAVDLIADHSAWMRAPVSKDYFCFIFNAPIAEGGYTYFVSTTWQPEYSNPVGIWVTAPPKCEDYTTKEDCEASGCYWYNNACHSAPARCEDITTQGECASAGCHWYNNACHSAAQQQPWWDKHKGELMLFGVGVAAVVVISKI